jgi:hypothetical protein
MNECYLKKGFKEMFGTTFLISTRAKEWNMLVTCSMKKD